MNIVAASVWSSPVVLGIVLAAVFVTVFLLSTMLAGGSRRRRRDKDLARRIGDSGSREDGALGGSPTQWVPSSFAQVGQRFAVATGFSASLDEQLEQAGLPILSGEFVALTAVCGLAGAVLASLLLPNIVFVLLIAAAAGLIPYVWMRRARQKRQNQLQDQLADTLAILASSLRAGYSFLQALDTVSKEIGEPSAGEFQRVVAEIRLGRPIDDALVAMAARIKSDDLKWAVIAINVQRQVGGNLAEVLDTVANTVRERAYIRRQARVLSAEGRISVAILVALPFIMTLYLSIVNPKYIRPLFTTTAGLIMLFGAIVMMAVGIFIMSRIVKIDV
jgi:tight adherence protein B